MHVRTWGGAWDAVLHEIQACGSDVVFSSHLWCLFTCTPREHPSLLIPPSPLRDWSLITGRGGATKWERGVGHVKFYPYEKGGGKSFSHAEGGHKKFRGSFFRSSLKF